MSVDMKDCRHDCFNELASLSEPSSSASSLAKGDECAEPSLKKKKLSANLSFFIVTTPKSTKETKDRQIAKAMFATNVSFRSIEHREVKNAISFIRPGYIPGRINQANYWIKFTLKKKNGVSLIYLVVM